MKVSQADRVASIRGQMKNMDDAGLKEIRIHAVDDETIAEIKRQEPGRVIKVANSHEGFQTLTIGEKPCNGEPSSS